MKVFDLDNDVERNAKFARMVAVCEANSFELLKLWEDHSNRAPWWADDPMPKYEWVDGVGYIITVGTYSRKPVVISINLCEVDHKLIGFWHVTSMVAHYDLIEKWFRKNLPHATRSNAMNFANCLK